MATIKLSISVDEIESIFLQYTHIQVWRCATRDGVYAEITTPSTRVALAEDDSFYEYIDATAPTTTYWYKTRYYHDTTLDVSEYSDPMQGIDGGLYCTLQDIRDEGITTTELSDERALALSTRWQQWFEAQTKNFFVPKEATVDLDGDGSRMLLLPVPIINVSALYINDDFVTVVDPTTYAVYNSRGPVQDDRSNPRIMLKRSTTDIFAQMSGKFNIGDRNQRIIGTWGYTESDGSTPLAVSHAVLVLVTLTKEYLPDDQIDQLISGRIVEEVTDRHRAKYADLVNNLKMWSPTGISEVDMALRRYKRPIRIAAPRTMRGV